uniref:Peptidase A2 domain-containing protein n=1 Tax=Biomphalaria glabrata TaxID=6526 RepID=A0A2C9L1Z0_BIOGL
MVEKALNEREPYQTSRRSKKTFRSWNCNTPGHVRRNYNMMFQDQGCVSERQPLRFTGFREQGLASQKIGTPRITTPFRVLEQSRTLRVQGKIGVRSYRFLLDTGATRSIVRPSLIGDQEIIRVNGYTLKTAGGEQLPILGQIRLDFEIGSQLFSHDFLIANVVDDCILGLDFMQEFGLSLNIGSGIVQYGDIKFPLLNDDVEGVQ